MSIAAPSAAQKQAGNYPKHHVNVRGLRISIENPAGSTRSGTDPDGNEWSQELKHHYGYIRGTQGRDKDHVDVFLGPEPHAPHPVFVVNQVDQDGEFDEHKVMLGFPDKDAAVQAYHDNYEEGWRGADSVATMAFPKFRQWVTSGRKLAPAKDIGKVAEPQGYQSGGLVKTAKSLAALKDKLTPAPEARRIVEAAVSRYSNDDPYRNSTAINDLLRGGEMADAEATRARRADALLDGVFRKHAVPLPEDAYAFRSAPPASFGARQPAYTSVTSDRQVAENFAGYDPAQRSEVAQVRIPAGTKVLPGDQFTRQMREGSLPEEDHFILPKDFMLRKYASGGSLTPLTGLGGVMYAAQPSAQPNPLSYAATADLIGAPGSDLAGPSTGAGGFNAGSLGLGLSLAGAASGNAGLGLAGGALTSVGAAQAGTYGPAGGLIGGLLGGPTGAALGATAGNYASGTLSGKGLANTALGLSVPGYGLANSLSGGALSSGLFGTNGGWSSTGVHTPSAPGVFGDWGLTAGQTAVNAANNTAGRTGVDPMDALMSVTGAFGTAPGPTQNTETGQFGYSSTGQEGGLAGVDAGHGMDAMGGYGADLGRKHGGRVGGFQAGGLVKTLVAKIAKRLEPLENAGDASAFKVPATLVGVPSAKFGDPHAAQPLYSGTPHFFDAPIEPRLVNDSSAGYTDLRPRAYFSGDPKVARVYTQAARPMGTRPTAPNIRAYASPPGPPGAFAHYPLDHAVAFDKQDLVRTMPQALREQIAGGSGRAFNPADLEYGLRELAQARGTGALEELLEFSRYQGLPSNLIEELGARRAAQVSKLPANYRTTVSVDSGRGKAADNEVVLMTDVAGALKTGQLVPVRGKYADGGSTNAAFGHFPQLGRRRPQNNDRTAAASMPLSASRGWLAGTLGLPGDITALAKMGAGAVADAGTPLANWAASDNAMPTSEFYNEWLPGRAAGASSRFAEGLGNLTGGAGATAAVRPGVAGAQGALRVLEQTMGASRPAYVPAKQAGVVKLPGGNWTTAIPQDLDSALRYARGDMSTPDMKWATGPWAKYIKNEFGSANDPLRAQALRDEGHFKLSELQDRVARPTEEQVARHAEFSGPREPYTAYDNFAGHAINVRDPETEMRWLGNAAQPKPAWLQNAPADTRIHKANPLLLEEFSHVFDYVDAAARAGETKKLYGQGALEAMARTEPTPMLMDDLDLIRRGLDIDPDKLNALDVPSASLRTAKWDEYLSGAKLAEDLNKGTKSVLKTYPESGHKWIDVSPEGLRGEGQAMHHCVGKDPKYCQGVVEGTKKIISLRGPDMKPAATLELVRPTVATRREAAELTGLTAEDLGAQYTAQANPAETSFAKWFASAHPQPWTVAQIKGSGNRSPRAEVLPMIQDFIRGTDIPGLETFSEVRELHNAGLRKFGSTGFRAEGDAAARSYPLNIPEAYYTKDELDTLLRAQGLPEAERTQQLRMLGLK